MQKYYPTRSDSPGTPLPRATGKPGRVAGRISVDAMEHYGNRRPRVERLVSAWNQGICDDAAPVGEPDDPLIGALAEPSKRPRTRLTNKEVDGMQQPARAASA